MINPFIELQPEQQKGEFHTALTNKKQRNKIRNEIKNGIPVKQISSDTGIPVYTINHIKYGETHTDEEQIVFDKRHFLSDVEVKEIYDKSKNEINDEKYAEEYDPIQGPYLIKKKVVVNG